MNTSKEFDIHKEGICEVCKTRVQISTGWKLISVCSFFNKRLINFKQLKDCKAWLRQKKTCEKCQHFSYEPETGRRCLKGHVIINNKIGMPKPRKSNCWEELKK